MIFAVLEQWLLQLTETDSSFVLLLEIAPFNRLAFYINYDSVLFVRYYQITVEKIAYFDLRQVRLMSQFWVTLFEFHQDLWHRRVCVILLLAILLEL